MDGNERDSISTDFYKFPFISLDMTLLCSLQPLIPHYERQRPLDWAHEFSLSQALNVEIGFGVGEFLIRSALESAQQNFIGIEENWERTFKTLKIIDEQKKSQPGDLENVRLLHMDAVVAFERLFREKTIDIIYSLFPCPWPKKGHVKNRLFSQKFLCLFNSRLKDSGRLKIVTDFKPYFDWILEEIEGTGFKAAVQTAPAKYDTKFERKWMKAGQHEFYEIELHKINHIAYPTKEDVEVKSYRLKDFNPEEFTFDKQTGAVSVIGKDIIYDAKRQIMMIETIVAEENLTQHFRIQIAKEDGMWWVKKALGQQFFPTPGIVHALEVIHKAALAQSSVAK